jgi:hypothetical protein
MHHYSSVALHVLRARDAPQVRTRTCHDVVLGILFDWSLVEPTTTARSRFEHAHAPKVNVRDGGDIGNRMFSLHTPAMYVIYYIIY